jgi:hypothetical protein
MPSKFAKLAGLGAFGASAGLLAIYLGLVFLTLPRPRGGIDPTNAAVAWIALGGLFAALIAVHVVIGRQLLKLAEKPYIGHPL